MIRFIIEDNRVKIYWKEKLYVNVLQEVWNSAPFLPWSLASDTDFCLALIHQEVERAKDAKQR